jgi:REP element-mobilizing transposase RayT
MGLRFKNQEFGECFFVTTSFKDREPLGNYAGVYEILATAINFQIDEMGAKLIAYVLMPTHLHLLMAINGQKLSDFIRDFKKYTSQKALLEYCPSKKAWQYRYDRQAIWSGRALKTKIVYIHNNPLTAGLVSRPEDWFWSSAADYLGREKGPLAIWREWY